MNSDKKQLIRDLALVVIIIATIGVCGWLGVCETSNQGLLNGFFGGTIFFLFRYCLGSGDAE